MRVPTSREWLTADEAADERLPGLLFTARWISQWILRAGVATRFRNSSGGRRAREFHWSSLPGEARAEYAKRHATETRDLNPCREQQQTGKDLLAEARGLIVKSWLGARTGRTKNADRKRYCAAYNARKVKLDDWVFRLVPSIEPHQIALWECRLRRGEDLRDGRGRPSGTALFDHDLTLKNYVVAAVAARPLLSATAIRKLITTDLGREIPLRTLQHFLKHFRATAKPELKALTNPDRYRSHHKPAFGVVGARIERINQRWEIDASPADAMCLVDGRELRYKLIGCIDVFTRRAMIVVTDQARAVATMALLRRAILAWGLPELVKIDNGKEFKNRAVERFAQDAGIITEFSRAFTPEQKPHIERFFGTLTRDLFELLPGYIGHNVAERQGIEARRSFQHRFGEDAHLAFGVQLSPEALQARIDGWCNEIYARHVHEGIKRTPHDLALAFAGDVRRLPDERVLDALLLDAPDASGIRVVAKSGIRIGNRFYVAGELGEWMGHRVHCRFDPFQPEQIVVYNDTRTKFICVARDRDQMDGADLAREAVRAQKLNAAKITDIRSAVRGVQRRYPADGAADRLLIDARQIFVPDPESAEAMRMAARPALIAQAEAMQALSASAAPPRAIEPTPEQRESAEIFHLEEAARHTPLPERMEQCDGYERPRFIDDDLGFYAWLTGHRDMLDQADRLALEDFESDPSFQDLLNSKQKARA
jgi:transposase InsO family protein